MGSSLHFFLHLSAIDQRGLSYRPICGYGPSAWIKLW